MSAAERLAASLAGLMRSSSENFADLVRAAKLNPKVDFRNADLSGVDLRDTDMSAFDLRGASLRGALIDGARFNRTVSRAQRAEAAVPSDPPGQPPAPWILVLFAGARAEQISRSIEPLDWSPDVDGADSHWRFVLTKDREAFERRAAIGRIHVCAVGSAIPDGDFDLVVALADGGHDVDASSQWLDLHFRGAVRLLAPALPKDRPAPLLTERRADGFAGIVDTSVARSPFWSGNPSRALDRRIADTVIGVAAVVASSASIMRAVSQGPGYPLLSLAFGPGDPVSGHGRTLALSSEAAGLIQAEPGLADLHQFQPFWIRQRPKDSDRGLLLVSLRTNGDIAGFLKAAGERAAPQLGGDLAHIREIPTEIRDELEFAEHVSGLAASRSSGVPVAILAETPQMKIVGGAARAGWRVARYTDDTYIAGALTRRAGVEPRQLPDELQLPKLNRRSENQGLVTRGADSRDIIVFSRQFLDELRSRTPTLASAARRFRPSFTRSGEAEYMLATYEISGWLAEAGDAPMRAELETLRAEKPRVPKRPADLRVACAKPRTDAMRFALADGLLPIRLDRLAVDEVPAQSMFVIDGDLAVPALLQSSVFAAWARATATRSTSWMASRFSVTRTFETFPIIGSFTLDRNNSGIQLRLGQQGKLADLARNWLERLDHVRDPAVLPDDLVSIRRQLDEAILEAYRLPSGAGNLQIMERLLDLNNSA